MDEAIWVVVGPPSQFKLHFKMRPAMLESLQWAHLYRDAAYNIGFDLPDFGWYFPGPAMWCALQELSKLSNPGQLVGLRDPICRLEERQITSRMRQLEKWLRLHPDPTFGHKWDTAPIDFPTGVAFTIDNIQVINSLPIPDAQKPPPPPPPEPIKNGDPEAKTPEQLAALVDQLILTEPDPLA
jgi:hypothetical protein